MSALKPEDIVFSFKKPYLRAYSFFSSFWDLLSGKSKLTTGKDRFFHFQSHVLNPNKEIFSGAVYEPQISYK